MFTIVIQAGGASQRMGRDKALIPFLGRPLIQRVVDRVRPLADELLVTTNQPADYHFLGLPLFTDLYPGRGALGGLYTALQAAQYDWVGVVACDMPFVSPALLQALLQRLQAEECGAAVPRTPHGAEPFHSVYRRSACLPAIQTALEAEKWRADAWYDAVPLCWFEEREIQLYDPAGLAFRNVNTPEELAAAEKLALKGSQNA
ncbi:MAG TPA: molybdenum cofactor guanylyltransferase [Anaerolineales bacterium]|nr:molybdenum cofactor guanylyltransferase [Anaerolineales bacterium]